jgi:hypothetical protein
VLVASDMCHMRIYCAVAAGLHIEQFPICLTLLKHVSHVSHHYSHHSQSTYLHPRVSVRPVDSTRTLVVYSQSQSSSRIYYARAKTGFVHSIAHLLNPCFHIPYSPPPLQFQLQVQLPVQVQVAVCRVGHVQSLTQIHRSAI